MVFIPPTASSSIVNFVRPFFGQHMIRHIVIANFIEIRPMFVESPNSFFVRN